MKPKTFLSTGRYWVILSVVAKLTFAGHFMPGPLPSPLTKGFPVYGEQALANQAVTGFTPPSEAARQLSSEIDKAAAEARETAEFKKRFRRVHDLRHVIQNYSFVLDLYYFKAKNNQNNAPAFLAFRKQLENHDLKLQLLLDLLSDWCVDPRAYREVFGEILKELRSHEEYQESSLESLRAIYPAKINLFKSTYHRAIMAMDNKPMYVSNVDLRTWIPDNFSSFPADIIIKDDQPLLFSGDEAALFNAILNLVQNAVTYGMLFPDPETKDAPDKTPLKSKAQKIQIQLLKSIHGGLEIRVVDFGPGIPADDLRKINGILSGIEDSHFTRHQTKTPGQDGKSAKDPKRGNGLGIIGHNVRILLQGNVHANSTIGAGSIFTIELPAAGSIPPDPSAPPDPNPPKFGQAMGASA